jgi:hypothetical protein
VIVVPEVREWLGLDKPLVQRRVMIESCVWRERRRILGELWSHLFRFTEGYAQ